jgi:hypothetical protein
VAAVVKITTVDAVMKIVIFCVAITVDAFTAPDILAISVEAAVTIAVKAFVVIVVEMQLFVVFAGIMIIRKRGFTVAVVNE